jgi:hypothetical protein
MGQCSAMSSMQRVLKKHHRLLRNELKRQFPSKLIKKWEVSISDDCYGICRCLVLKDGTEIELKQLDIDALAERFPGCEVGY